MIKEPIFLVVRERLAITNAEGTGVDLSSALLTKNSKPIAIFVYHLIVRFLTLNAAISNCIPIPPRFTLLPHHYVIIPGNGWAQQRANKQVKTALGKCVITIPCHYFISHYQFCTLSIFMCKRKNLSKWSYWIGYIKGLCYVFKSHLPVKKVHLAGMFVHLSVSFFFFHFSFFNALHKNLAVPFIFRSNHLHCSLFFFFFLLFNVTSICISPWVDGFVLSLLEL